MRYVRLLTACFGVLEFIGLIFGGLTTRVAHAILESWRHLLHALYSFGSLLNVTLKEFPIQSSKEVFQEPTGHKEGPKLKKA